MPFRVEHIIFKFPNADKFINPHFLSSSLRSYNTMANYQYQMKNGIYDSHSGYSVPQPVGYVGRMYRITLPEHEAFEGIQKDAATLAEMLNPVYLPGEYQSIAEQVFGSQARQQRLSMKHLASLLEERVRLHQRHLKDIAHRDMHIQERLFGAQLHWKLDGGRRATNLEKILVELDKDKRQEELAFWKDTAELRTKMFELAGEYGALQHRLSLLEDMEYEEEADYG